jgi:hypothetical protein
VEGEMTLELAAMRWLWLEQNCLVVLEERTPKSMMGQPDVIGVTKGRYLTEVEIKRSISDFKADFKKPHRANRVFYMPNQPRQFYYLVPQDLVEQVKTLLPNWAGLMTTDSVGWITVLVKSPVNSESKKLGVKDCARLSRMMTSHMMGYAFQVHAQRAQWKNHDDTWTFDWVDAENGCYFI